MDDLFAPPAAQWQRVSPRLATARRIVLAVFGTVLLAAVGTALAVGALRAAFGVPLLAGLLLVAGWLWWLIGRTVRRWGYAETDEDLFITSGAIFRRLVVVPYGRMQYVDVQAGPLDRALGIAKIQLHTASPGTTAVVPGVPADEATRLRDRLTARGESQAAGL